jgi:hypothetical protein
MKLPFVKRRRRVDNALAALGIMPKIRIGHRLILNALNEYDDYPPAPDSPEEMCAALGSANLNRALRRRTFSSFLRYG